MSLQVLNITHSVTHSTTDTHTVVVIDPYEVVHAGIKSWLTDDRARIADVVDHYRSIEEFLMDGRAGLPGTDIILAGLDSDDREPDFAALRELCASGHRVVVYSHLRDRDVIRTSIESGAVTYLVKSEGREHLVEAVRALAAGTRYVGPAMAQALRDTVQDPRPVLAPREREVLIAWFRTESKELVAQQLFLAPSTVRTHLQRIRTKYAAAGRPASTKAALVARAIQDRIIDIDDL